MNLDAVLGEFRPAELSAAVDRLMAAYRSGSPPELSSPVDVAAYAAYRMPATYGAVRAALSHVAIEPRSLLDLGGGTGAATWAALEAFPSLEEVTVVDRSAPALTLGQRLLPTATWVEGRLDEPRRADLAILSYVLGELADVSVLHAVDAPTVVVVEPGTPAGYARVIEARAALLGAGYHVVAPCPHSARCPMEDLPEWCHFSTRIARSALHRRLKGATLAHEDEKFSYVAATREPAGPATGRIVGWPRQRKGLVSFPVCSRDDGLVRVEVSKREGDRYRTARRVAWGDPWATG